MTAFLVVLVIILFGVAVWQMDKIFQMSKSKDSSDSEVASDKDNNINGYLMLGFVFFTYILLIYCFWEWGDVLLPEAASEHGQGLDTLMYISMALIFFVGFITLWLLSYFAFKYRGKKENRALFLADKLHLL